MRIENFTRFLCRIPRMRIFAHSNRGLWFYTNFIHYKEHLNFFPRQCAVTTLIRPTDRKQPEKKRYSSKMHWQNSSKREKFNFLSRQNEPSRFMHLNAHQVRFALDQVMLQLKTQQKRPLNEELLSVNLASMNKHTFIIIDNDNRSSCLWQGNRSF